jgi:hypothetical protein
MFRSRSSQVLVVLFAAGVSAKTWYVSPLGAGAKDGSTSGNALAGPVAGIAKATAGDTVLLLGGTYALSSTIKITTSGTANARICLFAENAATKRAILDFSTQAVGSSAQGMSISGSYWHIRGIDVYKAGDNGILFQGGSNNILEFANVHENSDAGVQLKGGAANNLILNTDSWWNYDAATSGGNADGFAPKMDVGSGNIFRGCRSWGNSDDGWDGYLRAPSTTATWTASTTLEDCWTFDNGYYHGDPNSALNDRAEMNGNGFKMGGGDKVGTTSNGYGTQHHHVLRRCLSFNNFAKGFDQNNNRGSMTLFNCTGMNNGTNYQIDGTVSTSAAPTSGIATGQALTVKNSISTGTGSVKLTAAVEANNSWSSGFTVASSDFQSVDSAGLRAARKADGSLPDITFLHLKPTSKLVNAGVQLAGISFNGSAPDLGAFEVPVSVGVEREVRTFRSDLRLAGGLDQVAISADLQSTAHLTVQVYGATGRVERTLDLGLWLPGERTERLDLAGLGRGVHLVELRSDLGLGDTRRVVVR